MQYHLLLNEHAEARNECFINHIKKMHRLILFILIACAICSCSSLVTTSLEAGLFEERLQQTVDPQLIDVRTAKEFSSGYIPGAVLIDIKLESFDSQIQKLDRRRPVFVYCRSGKRSLEAAKAFEKYQFRIVYNLNGGILAWEKSGKTIIKSNDTAI
jgi:rhodanese-related sulfurtransferase